MNIPHPNSGAKSRRLLLVNRRCLAAEAAGSTRIVNPGERKRPWKSILLTMSASPTTASGTFPRDPKSERGVVSFSRREDGRFELHARLWLPRPIDEVFAFFADAGNLDAITPDHLRFEILTPHPVEMREGLLLDYRLRLRGIPLRWQSLLSAWEPPHRFVDEQVRGPYRTWIHEHTFEPCEGGTLCGDLVIYDMLGGRLTNALLVQRDLARIFEHRCKRLNERFGNMG